MATWSSTTEERRPCWTSSSPHPATAPQDLHLDEDGPGHRYGRAELELCEQQGLAFLAYSPLGGLAAGDRFAQVAAQHQVSPHRVALAWELSLSPAVIPIPGATRPETILDSVQAAALTLSPADRRLLGGVTDQEGTR